MISKIIKFIVISSVLLSVSVYPLNGNLLSDAEDAFNRMDVDSTLKLVQEHLKSFPDDPNGLYFMGRYLHYKLYDTGKRVYDEKQSDKVLEWLNKSVLLTDTIGNAFYYLGVEYGVRGHYAMISGDTLKAKNEFKNGRNSKGYPDWMLECAKNTLQSCSKNAIIVGGGDAELNSIWYLQTCENYRRDVTAVPVGLLSYPPFVKFIKNGINNFFNPIEISFSNDSIDSMAPVLCDSTKQTLPVSKDMLNKYKLKNDYKMEWILNPDMEYQGNKITMTGTKILIDILNENKWRREICFTLGTPDFSRASLNDYLQVSGFVLKLTPKILSDNEKIDVEQTEKILMNPNNFTKYPDIKKLDYPRCSMILSNYIATLLQLSDYYENLGETKKQKAVLIFIKKHLDVRGPHLFKELADYLDAIYLENGI